MVIATEVKKVLSKHLLTDGFDVIVDLDKSHGSWLVDKRNGDEYLDFFSMFASLAVGFNHPYLVSKKAELGRVAVNKPANSDIYSEEMADFLETFSRVGIPDYLPHAFFVSGGGLAVENALKAAFDWKVRKNFEKGETEETGFKVLHLKEAFHGRTGYTLTLTNTSDPRKTQYFPKFDWPRVTNPKLKFPLETNREENEAIEKKSLAEIREIVARDAKHIACMILEPIQGEGGDNHFAKSFFQAIRKICDENEILLVFDEVQSGVGLTGKFWAHQNYDVKPDILCFGKKTQVCGILAGPRLDEVKNNVFAESSRINSTWGGNLVDMVRFRYILEIIENEDLVENARIMGEVLLDELKAIGREFPKLISNMRGEGLMCAFDLPDHVQRNAFLSKMWENKVMILPCGDHTIRFRPHLNVSKDEIMKGAAVIRKVLKEM
ncbi:MAG: L-lysine 6-transaminase [Candidatus Marinimicrobia bacterium]|nr:L-lysine 6-transaminase [Candidatus Neomarinimicrobiota bacterium]